MNDQTTKRITLALDLRVQPWHKRTYRVSRGVVSAVTQRFGERLRQRVLAAAQHATQGVEGAPWRHRVAALVPADGHRVHRRAELGLEAPPQLLLRPALSGARLLQQLGDRGADLCVALGVWAGGGGHASDLQR